MDDYIIKDYDGNALISVEKADENQLTELYKPFTHCLVVVKLGDDYVLGWNKWRNRYEIFGGCIEENETPRECATRESYEELGIDNELSYLGVMKNFLMPDYFSNDERIEYGGLYGVSIENISINELYEQVNDRDEIAKLAFYSDIKNKENIAIIDEKLLLYYG